MKLLFLHYSCLVALNLVNCAIKEDEEPRRTFPIRRAIDGTRGRKYYEPEEGNPYDDYGSSDGRYDPYEDETDFSDIRNNVPGEPGVDYPAYTRLPQTEFACEGHFRGYYADEGAGCQVFHVCDGSFLVSSFLCPIGSIFSQKLLTCDWWSKVDCSLTRNYHAINSQSLVSQVDDDEILRKAFEMESVRSAGERIPVETVSQEPRERHQDPKNQRVFNYDSSVTERSNDLPTGREVYSDYLDYPTRLSSRYKSSGNKQNRQRYRDEDYYSQDSELEHRQNDKPKIQLHTIGDDFKDNRQSSLKNEFRPSYAPTVPTVVTTARRFYSPTVPTTYRPSTTTRKSFGRYDLDFESSDHLYTARGRSDETVKAATPSSSFPDRDAAKLKNDSAAGLIKNVARKTTNDDDKMEESESSHNTIHLPIHHVPQKETTVRSFQETIVSLDEKEKAIKQDLDRLTDQITETLSILTIDNENRNPAIFSYTHDGNSTTNEREKMKDISVQSIVENATNSSIPTDSKNREKPVEFLQPPEELQSQFRITVLEDASMRNETSWNSKNSSAANFTDDNQNVRIPDLEITPPILNDENNQRESRIIRIVLGNNATERSSGDPRQPKIFIEQVKSMDISPEQSSGLENVTGIIDGQFKTSEPVNGSLFNSTGSRIVVTASTTIGPDDSVDNGKILPLDDSNEPVDEDSTSKGSEVEERLAIVEKISTISSSVNNDSKESNGNEEIFSNATHIDDTIQVASSPVEVTLTVKKNEDIQPDGDVIRRLIEEQEIDDSVGAADYKNFEIVRSDQSRLSDIGSNVNNFNYETAGSKNEEINVKNEKLESVQSDRSRSKNYLRRIVDFTNASNLPRPFSLEQPLNVEIKTPSDLADQFVSKNLPSFSETPKNFVTSETTGTPIRTLQSIGSSKNQGDLEQSLETLEASSSGIPRDVKNHPSILPTFRHVLDGEKFKSNDKKVIFELPQHGRSLDFETGLPFTSEESNVRIPEEDFNARSNTTNEKPEKIPAETVVQTEFIPSLGFSLNTDEEREKYMEAVVKGLLHDISPIETTNNETIKTVES